MTVVEYVRAIRNLIERPENWVQNDYVHDINGQHCLLDSRDAVAYSLEGALLLISITSDPSRKVYQKMVKLLHEESPTGDFVSYSNAPTTTHRDILDLLNRVELRG